MTRVLRPIGRLSTDRILDLRWQEEDLGTRYRNQRGTASLIDLREVNWTTPGGIAAISQYYRAEHVTGRGCVIRRPANEDVFRYLQRIGLFKYMGVFKDKDFSSHAPKDRFVELTRISPKDIRARSQAESDLCRNLAGVVAPDEDDFRSAIGYCLGELISNVLAHAGTSGVACAQHIPAYDYVDLAVADHGIGIRQHISRNPEIGRLPSSREAIVKACSARTSGTHHTGCGPYETSDHTGNGLFAMRLIAREYVGILRVWSNDGLLTQNGGKTDDFGVAPFPGTMVTLRISRNIGPAMPELLKILAEEVNYDIREEDVQFE